MIEFYTPSSHRNNYFRELLVSQLNGKYLEMCGVTYLLKISLLFIGLFSSRLGPSIAEFRDNDNYISIKWKLNRIGANLVRRKTHSIHNIYYTEKIT